MKKPKFTVGQKLLLKPQHYAGKSTELRELTIEKVGTKWITARPTTNRFSVTIRLDKTTLRVASEDYPGGYGYLDMDDYNTREAITAAWHKLRAEIPYTIPVGVTMTDIHTAREALGL